MIQTEFAHEIGKKVMLRTSTQFALNLNQTLKDGSVFPAVVQTRAIAWAPQRIEKRQQASGDEVCSVCNASPLHGVDSKVLNGATSETAVQLCASCLSKGA
eukprot:4669293-Amphidinium_carterae.1